jgi:transposase
MKLMEVPITQVDDLSRSLVTFDQNTCLIVVVEMSEASWLVTGMVPGVDRPPLKCESASNRPPD